MTSRYTWTGAPRPWNVIQPRLGRCAKVSAEIITQQRDEIARLNIELEQVRAALKYAEHQIERMRKNA